MNRFVKQAFVCVLSAQMLLAPGLSHAASPIGFGGSSAGVSFTEIYSVVQSSFSGIGTGAPFIVSSDATSRRVLFQPLSIAMNEISMLVSVLSPSGQVLAGTQVTVSSSLSALEMKEMLQLQGQHLEEMAGPEKINMKDGKRVAGGTGATGIIGPLVTFGLAGAGLVFAGKYVIASLQQKGQLKDLGVAAGLLGASALFFLVYSNFKVTPVSTVTTR